MEDPVSAASFPASDIQKLTRQLHVSQEVESRAIEYYVHLKQLETHSVGYRSTRPVRFEATWLRPFCLSRLSPREGPLENLQSNLSRA